MGVPFLSAVRIVRSTRSHVSSKRGVGILFIIIAVFMAIVCAAFVTELDDHFAIKENGGAPDFNTLSIAEIKQEPYVDGNVEIVFDYFAEQYTTENGVRKSNKSDMLYYLIAAAPVDDAGYYDFQYLICLTAKPKDFNVLDRICEETWAENFEGDYTTFNIGTSKVKPIGDKLNGLLWEFIEENDVVSFLAETRFFGTDNEVNIKSRILPYEIVIGEEPASPGMVAVFFAITVFFLVAGILLLRKPKTAAGDPYTAESPYANPYAESQGSANAYAPASAQTDSGQSSLACPHCGAPVGDSPDGFCPYCGEDLEG